MLPMDQVLADRMSPTHMSPLESEWVVLIEQVVFALIVDRAVGIVHPVLGGREVKLRTMGFVIKLRGRGLSANGCGPELSAKRRDREYRTQEKQQRRGSSMPLRIHHSTDAHVPICGEALGRRFRAPRGEP